MPLSMGAGSGSGVGEAMAVGGSARAGDVGEGPTE